MKTGCLDCPSLPYSARKLDGVTTQIPATFPPTAAFASIGDDGEVTIRYPLFNYEIQEGNTKKDGKEQATKFALVMHEGVKHVHATKIELFDIKGNKLDWKILPERLKKSPHVLVSWTGPVDPFYLQIARDDTLILVVPNPLVPPVNESAEQPVSRANAKEGPTLQSVTRIGFPGANKDARVWLGLAKGRRENPSSPSFVFYPVDRQHDVPCAFAGREFPNPIPFAKEDRAGYPITVTFPTGTKISHCEGKLFDSEGHTVYVWLSSPESPANPDYASSQETSIAIIAKEPLVIAAKYTVEVSAEIDGVKWHAKWRFTTAGPIPLHEPSEKLGTVPQLANDGEARRDGRPLEKPDEVVAKTIVASINRHRCLLQLNDVVLDEELSKGCECHAGYVAKNIGKPQIDGLKIHEEDRTLPGFTPEGQRAGRSSIISLYISQPKGMIDKHMACFYHRIPIIDPALTRIGFGMAELAEGRWVVVVDVLSDLRKER